MLEEKIKEILKLADNLAKNNEAILKEIRKVKKLVNKQNLLLMQAYLAMISEETTIKQQKEVIKNIEEFFQIND